MDTLVNFILGGSSDPLEVAVRLLLFIILIDSLFGIINTLLNGVRK